MTRIAFVAGALDSDTVDEPADADSDTVDFSGCLAGPVTMDLSSSAQQVVSPGHLNLMFSTTTSVENFVGSQFSDTIALQPLTDRPRFINGEYELAPPGDMLVFDCQGTSFSDRSVNQQGPSAGVIVAAGYAHVFYSGIEMKQFFNCLQPTPTAVSIDDVSQAEGDAGTNTFLFTVSLSSATVQPVFVRVATADGTAGSPEDDTPIDTILEFEPGQTTKTVAVTVNPDATFEPDENFFVTLGLPVRVRGLDSVRPLPSDACSSPMANSTRRRSPVMNSPRS